MTGEEQHDDRIVRQLRTWAEELVASSDASIETASAPARTPRHTWLAVGLSAAALVATVVVLQQRSGARQFGTPTPASESTTSTAAPPPTTSTPPPADTATTETVVSTEADPGYWTSSVDVPGGVIDTGAEDLFVVHADGDLWLHPGILGDAAGVPVRLVDLGDPREPVVEGEGPNTVDGVVGDVDGLVFYTDCCEPVSGNLLAVGRPESPTMLGMGYSPVLSPDGTRLATVNSYFLTIIDLATKSLVSVPVDNGPIYANYWDLVWSADGASLIALSFDDSGVRLTRFDTLAPFAPHPSVDLGIVFEPDGGSIGFAGRGPQGEIAVVFDDGAETSIRFLDPTTLTEITDRRRALPSGVDSVRLGPDGVSLLWVDGATLWYLPAVGDVRRLGSDITAAWFAG